MAKITRPPETRRWGGPGSSRDDATKPPPELTFPPKSVPLRHPIRHSQVSGGGGERDVHHGHDPLCKRDFEAGRSEKPLEARRKEKQRD